MTEPLNINKDAGFDDRWNALWDTDPFGAAAMRTHQAVKPIGGRMGATPEGTQIAPLAQEIGNIAQERAAGLLDLYKTPGDVLQGKQFSDEDLIKRALGLAGETMWAASPFAQRGAAGVFGGRLSPAADKTALTRAEEMAAGGATRDEILWQTGWHRAEDGKWRFEISDQGASLNYTGEMKNWKLEDVLNHPRLFEAYPQLRNVRVNTDPKMEGASFHPKEGVVLGTKERVPDIGNLLHEIQHAVQRAEGFARGSSVDRELARLDDAPWWNPKQQLANIKKNYGKAVDAYFNTPGEREAYNVSNRMDMPASERNIVAPWVTEPKVSNVFERSRNPDLPGVVSEDPFLLGQQPYSRNSSNNVDQVFIAPKLTPVEHDPFTPPKLTPVEHDPFAAKTADEITIEEAVKAINEALGLTTFTGKGDVTLGKSPEFLKDPITEKRISSTATHPDIAETIDPAWRNYLTNPYTETAYRGVAKPPRQRPDVGGREYYSTESPELAGRYAENFRSGDPNIQPLKIDTSEYLTWDAKGKDWTDVNVPAINQAITDGKKGIVMKNVHDEPGAIPAGEKPKTVYITLDPGTVRSAFAAFDPSKWGLNDLLAGLVPGITVVKIVQEATQDDRK